MLLENMIAIELRRRGYPLYYYSGKTECDFILKRGAKVEGAIQVTDSLNALNGEREIEGLLEACSTHKLRRGTLLHNDGEEKQIRKAGITINIYPVWKWLLMSFPSSRKRGTRESSMDSHAKRIQK
jgi:predicted AAA+ superfamily ATPase